MRPPSPLNNIFKKVATLRLCGKDVVFELARSGRGESIVEKLKILDDSQIIKVFCTPYALAGLAIARQWDFVVDRFNKFNNDQIVQLFSTNAVLGTLLDGTKRRAVLSYVAEDPSDIIFKKLETLNDDQITQIFSTHLLMSAWGRYHAISTVEKLETLNDDQITQILSKDDALYGLCVGGSGGYRLGKLLPDILRRLTDSQITQIFSATGALYALESCYKSDPLNNQVLLEYISNYNNKTKQPIPVIR